MLLLGGVFYSAAVTAQNTQWIDFSYLKQSEAWLTAYNAAGLRYLPIEKTSIAELYANKQNGKFTNYYQSDNSYELGARVESYYRLMPRVTFYGMMNYNYFKGKNMGGSAFIDPYSNPFDIVEYSDENRGEKEKETYHLVGAVSGDLLNNLTLAGKIDYKAANYAKFKDLRHKNKLLDMYLTMGLSYRINKHIEVGANYFYRRSTEGIEFGRYGTTDKIYTSLIDYGAFYGVTETGEGGYVEEKDEKPLFNEYNGGSLQVNIQITPQISFFNEFTYKLRDGYYGKRSPSTIVYSEHDGSALEYTGVLSLKQKKHHHQLRVHLNREELENNQNTFRSETGSVGNSVIVYYDPIHVGKKETFSGKLQYTANLSVTDFNPRWTLVGSMQYFNREKTASVYPYYRKQTIHNTEYHVAATRNVMKAKDMYSFSLGISYLSGGGTEKEDGLYATPSDSQTAPRNSDDYLHREYEYLTNSRFSGRVGFKYSRQFNTEVKGYAKVSYSLTKASDIRYLAGDKQNVVNLVIGCTF
ncbi:hypothetical protein D0T60_17635 [Bacteroides sp. 224]|nr:hypothetical protein [Bacteroides sp. 224]